MNKLLSGVGTILFALVFLAAGIFNIVLGVGRLQKDSQGKYVETTALITHIESTETHDEDGTHTDYDITVEFQADGKKVVAHLGEIPKEFYEGMELTVLYNMDNPTEVVLPGTGGAWIMIGLGAVAILAAAGMLIKRIVTGQ